MTVITVVAIAAIAAFFYVLIWPSIQANMALTSACSSGEGLTSQNSGSNENDQGSVSCTGSRAQGDLTCKYTSSTGKEYTKKC